MTREELNRILDWVDLRLADLEEANLVNDYCDEIDRKRDRVRS